MWGLLLGGDERPYEVSTYVHVNLSSSPFSYLYWLAIDSIMPAAIER